MKGILKKQLSLLMAVLMVCGMAFVPGITVIKADAVYSPSDGDFAEYVRSNYSSADVFTADSVIYGLTGTDPVLDISLSDNNKTYKTMAKAAVEDTGLMFSSTFWMQLKNALKFDFVSMADWQNAFYETLLLDYLCYQADSDKKKDEFAKDTVKYSYSVMSKMLGSFDIGYKDAISKMSKSDAEALAQKCGYLGKINKYSGYLKDLNDVAKTADDYIKKLSQALQLRDIDQSRIEFLKKIKAAAPDDESLGLAVDKIIYKMEESLPELRLQICIDTCTKEVLKKSFSKIVSEIASPEIKLMLKGIELGQATLDFVFNSNDNADSNLKLAIIYILSNDCDIALRSLKLSL